jgi:hypothetical protein
MEQVYQDSAMRRNIGRKGQEFVLQHLAPTVVGGLMKARIREIVRRSQASHAASSAEMY